MSQVLLEMNENSCDLDGLEPLILNPEKVAKLHQCQNFLEGWISELSDLDNCEDLILIHQAISEILEDMRESYDELLTITD